MSKKCPFCGYGRAWRLRRQKLKCKRCRHEYSNKIYLKIAGVRATHKEWRACIETFLKQRTIKRIVEETGIGHCRVEKMVKHMRKVMFEYELPLFDGVTEIDETYIGGQRKNKKLHIRKISPPKRGHGTEKMPIIGLFNRDRGQVYIKVIVKEEQKRRRERKRKMQIFKIVKERVIKNSTIYTDSFPLYEKISEYIGCKHEAVNHNQGEYTRGDIHTNNIEGFWGILKRRMGCIGGMRRESLPYFTAEIVWKFNHRKLSFDDQINIMMDKISH